MRSVELHRHSDRRGNQDRQPRPGRPQSSKQYGPRAGHACPALPMARSTATNEERCMDEASTTLEAADIATILKALPHRYPFLMIDRIINMRGDESAIGL